MGWFWASTPLGHEPIHQTIPRKTTSSPPPGCPMHSQDESRVTITVVNQELHPDPSKPSISSCPIAGNPASSSTTASTSSKLNPLNFIPALLSQDRSQTQSRPLPTLRTTSSIPRGDVDSNWEYPSPQQMYNAMLRKGYDDTPEDAVESMVEVHNFLNEGAWNEIEGWEARFARGLVEGWKLCSKGEEAWQDLISNVDLLDPHDEWKRAFYTPGGGPRLVRFMGRPGDMTPKARMLELAGRLYPSKYGGELPFDRHDWFVRRTLPTGETREVRYVIDYYAGPPEPTGEPVFYLDVRPAIDSPTAACERLIRWSGDVWCRASGARTREIARQARDEKT